MTKSNINKHQKSEPKWKEKPLQFDCGEHDEMTRLSLALPQGDYPAPPPRHLAPASSHPAPPPRHLAPASSQPAPPPRHLAPASSQPAPPPRHLAPASSHPAPPPRHLAPAPQALKPRARKGRGGAGTAVQLRSGKQEQVPAAYPWADTRRARVLSLETLLSRGVREIAGTLQCKRCEKQFEVSHDLVSGFQTLATRIAMTKAEMNDRAPEDWQNPTLPSCRLCGAENSAQPVAAEKKRSINWLFLLLGGLLGCCSLAQLKYFCKHTKNHRTGAKDRVLYLTYLNLCNQLEPNLLFDPHHR